MAHISEYEVENLFIDRLESIGYEFVELRDYHDVVANFRRQLAAFNAEKLTEAKGEASFSDAEFGRVMIHVDNHSVYESAKILRDKYVLQLDNGKSVYLDFFGSDVDRNIYQVTHQVTMDKAHKDDVVYKNRYDVTILINGLPIVQIELKRPGVEINEAINQINRYRKFSFKGLFRYLQLFVVSNSVQTKYFCNENEMDGDIERHFRNANYIGFTGTPIFEANRGKDGRTTADVFYAGTKLDACLHRYMIKDAIADGNVLRFSVEYQRTIFAKQVAAAGIDPEQMDDPDYCRRHNLDLESLYHDDERIRLVAADIFEHHEQHVHPQGKGVDTADLERDVDLVMREIERSDNDVLRAKKDVMEAFIRTRFYDLPEDADVQQAYEQFERESMQAEIEEFAHANGLEAKDVQDILSEYTFGGNVSEEGIRRKLAAYRMGLLKITKMTRAIKEFVIDTYNRYRAEGE